MKHKNASSQFFPSGLKDIVPKVINYCKTELDIPEHILISVEYEDLSEEGVKGWAIDSPEKDEYDIEIDCNLGIDESLLTICHEMVHVSQMYREDKLDEGEAEKKEKILYDGYVEKFSTTTPSKMTTNEYVRNLERKKLRKHKKSHYKFSENKILFDIQSYIDDTYSSHYAQSKKQATEIIIDQGHGTGFCIGNILKYAQRYGKKDGHNKNDLMKVIHYAIIQLSQDHYK